MSKSATNTHLSPAKRSSFEVLSVVLPLSVCFVLLEIGLRIFGPEYHRFNYNSREYYSNPRGYFEVVRKEGKHTIYGIPIRTEGDPSRRIPDDMQDDEVEAFLSRKATILGLGDSFTAGQGVRYEHVYLRQLEKLLAKNGTPVLIDNTGERGYDLMTSTACISGPLANTTIRL